MNCKNCNTELSSESNFCHACGAKVVKERIAFKAILVEIFNKAFGWDNKFFTTIRQLIIHPDIIFREYIEGVRKRYVNPITFFAIGMTLSLIFITFYKNEILEVYTSEFKAGIELTQGDNEQVNEKVQEIVEFADQFQFNLFKYYNFYSFLLLPLYTLMAFIIYRKPYNYGEHFVVNAYIQGILFLFSIIMFACTVIFNTGAYNYIILITVLYYIYAYSKFYKLSFWQNIKKILLFIGLAIGIYLVFSVLVVAIVMMT